MAVVENQEARLHVLRRPLEEGLHDAEWRTLDEIDRVRDLLDRALAAALFENPALIDEVVASAKEAERHYSRVHDALLALIARQAPVARDLRLAMALLHVNDRLERIGAQCVNIATMCRAMPDGERPSREQLSCLAAMGGLASKQLLDARDAFADRDPGGMERLRRHDKAINEHNRDCFSLAVQEDGSDGHREASFFAALMARAIERIGDNAVDIAQQASFVATGRLRPATGS